MAGADPTRGKGQSQREYKAQRKRFEARKKKKRAGRKKTATKALGSGAAGRAVKAVKGARAKREAYLKKI